jgi:FAD/FMN-containing dehydrogenase
MTFESWGRFPRAIRQNPIPLHWRQERWSPPAGQSVLPRGQGRSYGDSCLNDGGALLVTGALDHFLDFDAERGVLRCEGGVTLDAIARLAVPRGWFLPVTPGTRFVSLGGAIANDVHGKNHHRAGTFGRFVDRLELVRSDGGRRVCGPDLDPEWFAATVGGLGLTGLITWAELRLMPIRGPWVDQETIRFGGLDEFFALSRDSEAFEYTVAWVDSFAQGHNTGRGIFFRGNHSASDRPPRITRSLGVPCELPGGLLNRLSMALFNRCLYARHRGTSRRTVPYPSFFYPLDGVSHWNRIYGPRGFLQYQCVVPIADARAVLTEILGRVAASGLASFLSVLKIFGSLPSPGLLSFPRAGVTLALDFPNTGEKLLGLLEELDRLVRTAGGALYPAKDARMSGAMFRHSFPRLGEFEKFVDPAFSSGFWRRVRRTE